MLDFGVKIDGFCSDLTRMIFFKRVSPEFRKIYLVLLRAQKAALKKISYKNNAQEIDKAARNVIERAGYGKYFLHGLGHGLGRKVHERPRLSPKHKDVVKIGDVITIEPGIYIKGRGGIRIEDDILVGREGIDILTNSPKELGRILVK